MFSMAKGWIMNLYTYFRSGIGIAVALFFSLALSACAQMTANAPTAPPLSLRDKSDLIERLEVAKREDWNGAMDPKVSPVTETDFLSQMNKADRAIKELTHGFDVPPEEISDALWIPPKSITANENARLIQELRVAEQQDDHNEQRMLNMAAWSDNVAPVDTIQFDQQKELADGVIKDLEIGEGVSWSTIKQALYVPPSPW
jgi:hypothetical protein